MSRLPRADEAVDLLAASHLWLICFSMFLKQFSASIHSGEASPARCLSKTMAAASYIIKEANGGRDSKSGAEVASLDSFAIPRTSVSTLVEAVNAALLH